MSALGGADAIQKVTSRVMKGTIQTGGSETPIELFTKAPNKRISISNGQSFTAFDGTAGWMGSTGRPAREMSATESEAAGLDAEFALALRLKEIFPATATRASRDDRRSGMRSVECDAARAAAGSALLRYFDRNSGCWCGWCATRRRRWAATRRRSTTPIIAKWTGVKSPFRWTLSRPNGRFTIQVKEAKNNVAD